MANPQTDDRIVGELLAEAMQAAKAKNRDTPIPWEDVMRERMTEELPDLADVLADEPGARPKVCALLLLCRCTCSSESRALPSCCCV